VHAQQAVPKCCRGEVGNQGEREAGCVSAGNFSKADGHQELIFATEDGKLWLQDNDEADAKGVKTK
jgi:hypothetical protein